MNPLEREAVRALDDALKSTTVQTWVRAYGKRTGGALLDLAAPKPVVEQPMRTPPLVAAVTDVVDRRLMRPFIDGAMAAARPQLILGATVASAAVIGITATFVYIGYYYGARNPHT